MKKAISLTGFLALLLLMPASAEAQLFEKLKRAAKEAAEQTILNRTRKEVSKGTDKAIDGVLKGGQMSEGASSGKLDGTISPEALERALAEAEPAPEDQNIKLPETYKFSYQLSTEVNTQRGKASVSYLLEPDKTYYAEKSQESGGDKYVIYDDEHMSLLHFRENGGSTEFWREKMDVFTAIRIVGAYQDGDNRQIKTLGKRELLGFTVQGYEIKTDGGLMEIWVTHDAPATMFRTMFSVRAEEKGSPFQAGDMILEMKYSNTENPDRNFHWICTAWQPHSKTFDIATYYQQ